MPRRIILYEAIPRGEFAAREQPTQQVVKNVRALYQDLFTDKELCGRMQPDKNDD
jgi:hypothetical protein